MCLFFIRIGLRCCLWKELCILAFFLPYETLVILFSFFEGGNWVFALWIRLWSICAFVRMFSSEGSGIYDTRWQKGKVCFSIVAFSPFVEAWGSVCWLTFPASLSFNEDCPVDVCLHLLKSNTETERNISCTTPNLASVLLNTVSY